MAASTGLMLGIFDHMDRGAVPVAEFYENRLRLIEAYDRADFYAYLVAEHHSTPLGMAPSPGIFLSAVAQRTKRLRFGPLVYTLPLYHPLRLIEEICMLDQMSGGRLEFGVGKGISPIETRYYGIDPDKSDAMFAEGYDLLRAGLTSKVLNFEGAFYQFKDVPLTLETIQKPYPPIWYGVVQPSSAQRAAKRGFKVMSNTATANVRATAETYWENFVSIPGSGTKPAFGMNRFLVVADTDEAAWAIARRAYRRWHASFMNLWNLAGIEPIGVNYPPEIDGQAADGRAVIGTPQAVLDKLQAQVEQTGVNYLGCRFAFGDMSLTESMRSIELFAEQVKPHLRGAQRVAAE